jgi:hypothetical protein
MEVRISTQRGASQADKNTVMNACTAVGITRIHQSPADE